MGRTRRRSGLASQMLAAAILPWLASPAPAQVWDGGGANASWNTANNWNPNGVPAAGTSPTVSGAGAPNANPLVDSNTNAYSLVTVSGGAVTVNATLSAMQLAIIGTGSVTVGVFGGVLGNVGVGSGGVLTNNGTLSGSLGVSGGTATNAGFVSGPTTISGGTLNLNAGSNLSDTQSLVVNDGTVNVNIAEIVGPLSGAGGQISFSNNVALTTTVAGSATYSGGMTGTIVTPNATYLAKTGTGTLVLNGPSTVAGPGRILVSAGTLAAGNGNAIADGTHVSLATGTTLRLDANETIGALTGGSGTAVSLGANTLTIAGLAPASTALESAAVLSGTGGLTVNAPGFTQTLTGASTYTGATTVTAGTLRIAANNVIANFSNLLVNGGIFDLAGQSEQVFGVSLQSGAIVGPGVLATSTGIDVRSGTISAALAGLVGLTKTTAGTVALTGANTYLGSTVVADGTLDVRGTGSLASTVIDVNGGRLNVDDGALPATAVVTVRNTGALGLASVMGIGSINQSGGTLVAIGPNIINLSGAYAQSGGGTGSALDLNAASFSQSGGATIGTGTTVTSTGAQSLQGGTIAGVLDGTGAVTVSGGTTLVSGRIDATSLSVTGGGVLRAGGASLSGSANLVVSNGRWEATAPTMLQSLQVAANGVVDFGTFAGSYRPVMVASFAGGGTIELNTRLGSTGSPSDQLVVSSGSVTGTTTLRVRNTDGLGAQTTGDGILLVEINGASPADAFVLDAPGFVSVGDYRYTLAKVGDHWYLQSTFSALFADGFE